MTRFSVEHHNHYRYASAVDLNYGEARLLPRDTPGQRVRSSQLILKPGTEDWRERLDSFGNRVLWFSLSQPHDELEVIARCDIERQGATLPAESPAWESAVRRLRQPSIGADLTIRECAMESAHVPNEPEITAYVRKSFTPGRPVLEAVNELTRRVFEDFSYTPQATHIGTPILDVLHARHGVCQDFAHLCLAGLRGLGLAARYVSGWLETTPPPGAPPQLGADASHAWISVYVPELGWFDFDPTNGIPAGEGHLTLAWGRDFDDVTPLKGVVFGGGNHQLGVGVTVKRLD